MKRNPKSETRYPNSLWRATNRNPLSPICNLQSAIGHRQFLVLFLLLTLPALASAQVAASLLAQRARYYESIGPGGQEYDSPNFPTLGGLADHQFIAYSLDDTNHVNPHDGEVILADTMGFGRLTSAPTVNSAMCLAYDGPKPKQEAGGFLMPKGVLAWIEYLAVVIRQGQPPVPQLVVPVLVRAMGSVDAYGAYDALSAGWLCVTSSVRVAVSGGPAQTLGFADGLTRSGMIESCHST